MEDDSPLFTPEDTGSKAKPEKKKRTASPPKKAFSDEPKDKALRREDSTTCLPGTNMFNMKVRTDANKYERIKRVGVGAYGSVFKARNEDTDEIVAIKLASRKEDPVYQGFPLSVLREIGILRRMDHENIVKLYEIAMTTNGDPLIVMEFCQASLLELLNSPKHGLSFSEVKYVSRQLLDATKHMHERGVLHRDLATKNILFNLSGEIKVCDFGISRMGFGMDEEYGLLCAKNLEDPNMIVSLPYRAIELLLGDRKYGPALDVWSVGCMIGEIFLCQAGRRQTFFGGDPRNPNRTPEAVVEEIFKILGRPVDATWPGVTNLSLWGKFTIAIQAARAHRRKTGEEVSHIKKFFVSGEGSSVNLKYALTDGCFDLLGGLFTLCPQNRISAEKALKHSWFEERPLPEWHKEHWAKQTDDIARGDEMKLSRKQHKDSNDILIELSKEEAKTKEADKETVKSLHEQVMESHKARLAAAQTRAKEADAKKQLSRQGSNASQNGDKLPPGWTKHWSSSKQKYYYHDSKTNKNVWDPPRS
jgi:serine/threonine protein kinase